jgi:hypothetical protein
MRQARTVERKDIKATERDIPLSQILQERLRITWGGGGEDSRCTNRE